MNTQPQTDKITPKEKLLQTTLKAVEKSITKEDGLTFADVEDICGTNTIIRAALCAKMKVFF